MNIAVQTIASRPLLVDFEIHTDGDDTFKQEIALLMISNIEELQESLNTFAEQQILTHFTKTCHKVASTLTMLNDTELMEVINKVKDASLSSDEIQSNIKLLHLICDSIILSLEKEIS